MRATRGWRTTSFSANRATPTPSTPSRMASASFNPTSLVLNDSTANASLVYASNIDLNAGGSVVSRNIEVDSVTNAATLNGTLSQSGGGAASLVKTGLGKLIGAGGGDDNDVGAHGDLLRGCGVVERTQAFCFT